MILVEIDIAPIPRALWLFFLGLRRPLGFIPLLALAVTLAVLSAIPFGFILAIGIWSGWYLLVIRSANEGVLTPPDPSMEHVGGVYGGLWRMLLGTLWTVGLMATVIMMGELAHLKVFKAAIAAAAAIVFMPASLLVTASVDSWIGLLDPRTPFRIIYAVGTSYLRLLLIWVLLVIGGVAASAGIAWTGVGHIPVLGGLIEQTLLLVPWTLSAFVIGWFAYEHAEALGQRTPAERMVPSVPNAFPVGPPAPRNSPARRREAEPAAVELVESAAVPLVTQPASRREVNDDHHDIDALPVDHGVVGVSVASAPAGATDTFDLADGTEGGAAGGLPTDSTQNTAEPAVGGGDAARSSGNGMLASALRTGDVMALVSAWNALDQTSATALLPGRQRLDVAQVLANGGRVKLSATILRGLAMQPDVAESADAAVALADLLVQRLGREREAIGLLEAFVARSPGAAQAHAALDALRSGQPPPG